MNSCIYLFVFIALYFIFFTYSELYTPPPKKKKYMVK